MFPLAYNAVLATSGTSLGYQHHDTLLSCQKPGMDNLAQVLLLSPLQRRRLGQTPSYLLPSQLTPLGSVSALGSDLLSAGCFVCPRFQGFDPEFP